MPKYLQIATSTYAINVVCLSSSMGDRISTHSASPPERLHRMRVATRTFCLPSVRADSCGLSTQCLRVSSKY